MDENFDLEAVKIIMASDAARQYVPLTCHGHSRPVPHMSFSHLEKEETYYMISACKGLRWPAGSSPDLHQKVVADPRLRWKPDAQGWCHRRLVCSVGRATLFPVGTIIV